MEASMKIIGSVHAKTTTAACGLNITKGKRVGVYNFHMKRIVVDRAAGSDRSVAVSLTTQSKKINRENFVYARSI